MEKGRSARRLAGALMLMAAVAVFGIQAQGVEKLPAAPDGSRSDVVAIDGLEAYGGLEEPPVTFYHDKHSEAVEKQGGDCSSCHPDDEATGRMSLKFKRLADTSKDAVKDLYHKECVACHAEYAAKGVESGPAEGECRSCHTEKPEFGSDRREVVVDRELHYRHAVVYADAGEPCAACHHAYDEAAQKTVPVAKPADVQGSCSYCHGEETVTTPGANPETVRSERLAVHDSCLSCHRALVADKKDAGPVKCSGCHSAESQAEISKKNAEKTEGKDLRMKREQPDALLVKAGPVPDDKAALEGEKQYTMGPVAFDHKFHEENVENCSACHHQALESCSENCHTVAPKAESEEKGGGVLLERAMHQASSTRSCVGCHAKEQEKPECAACHSLEKKGLNRSDPTSCASCHTAPVEGAPQAVDTNATMAVVPAPAPIVTDGHAADPQAMAILDGLSKEPQLIALDDIPETVILKALADEYKEAEFPHRKIVLALAKGVKDSKLASAFHNADTSLCQGCHHMSPASATPPKCSSCHGQPFDEEDSSRPGLKAAYHQQCMSCHTAMGIDRQDGAKAFGLEKPVPAAADCVGCHKAK